MLEKFLRILNYRIKIKEKKNNKLMIPHRGIVFATVDGCSI